MLTLALLLEGAGCAPLRVRLIDAASESSVDGVVLNETGESPDGVSHDGGLDGGDGDDARLETSVDAPVEVRFDAIESSVDAASDGPSSAPDAGDPDAPVVDAVDARGPQYRVDRIVRTTVGPIGSGAYVAGSMNERFGDCGSGVVASIAMYATSNPSDLSWVHRIEFSCLELASDGRLTLPASTLPVLARPPLGEYPTTETRMTEREYCPPGFVSVGVQGELSYEPVRTLWFLSRMGLVCARPGPWAALAPIDVTPNDPIFVQSRRTVGTTSDAGARDADLIDATTDVGVFVDASVDSAATTDAARSDAGPGPVGSDLLPVLEQCTDSVRADSPACAFPIYGGRPMRSAGMSAQPYFRMCPGGYVFVGLRAMTGYYVDRLELVCGRISAE